MTLAYASSLLDSVKFNGPFTVQNPRYVVLENAVPYDWDDYGVWADTLFDRQEMTFSASYYGHGCGPDPLQGYAIGVHEAIESGLFTEEAFKVAMICAWIPGLLDLNVRPSITVDDFSCLNIPCTVGRGRKWKGSGIFLHQFDTEFELPVYCSWRRGGIVKTSRTARILDVQNNTIVECNRDYVVFDEEPLMKVMEEARVKVIEQGLKNFTLFTLYHMKAYNISYSGCDTRMFGDYIRDLRTVKGSLLTPYMEVDLTNVKDPIGDERNRKAAEYRAKKRQDIINWAATLEVESEEERQRIIERTINKYGYND